MLKKLLFSMVFLAFTSFSSYSQESCSCSNTAGGCSASQTCPAGKSAVCVCNPGGCASSCSQTSDEPPPAETPGGRILGNPKQSQINDALSFSYGLNVRFQSFNKGYKVPVASKNSSWNLLEELDKNGELSINGQKLGFWRSVSSAFSQGEETKVCFGGATPRTVLNVISFISGKRYSITSGDSEAEITGQVKGNSVDEIIQSLQKIAKVTISETE